MQVAQDLERCYTQYSTYNHDSCSVLASGAVISEQGFYEITAVMPNGSTFTLTATPQDEDATTLTLTHLGVHNWGKSGSAKSSSSDD